MKRMGDSIGRRAALALLVSPLASRFAFGAAQDRPVEPYVDRTKHQMLYEGPGGDEPEPTDLKEVRIGYFGPSDAAHVEGGSFWLGASKAIREANKEGGYHGLPFRLVAKWSDSPWKAGGRMMVELAYVDQVWAVIGSIDGVATHIAEQVVAKVQLSLVDPGSTDRSVNAAMVPWMFSCLPGDPAIAAALCPALAREAGEAGPALLVSTGHDERHMAEEFKHWFADRQPGIGRIIEFQPGDGNLDNAVRQAAGARAALVLGGVADTAQAVKLLRAESKDTAIYAGPAAAKSSFLPLAGSAADGVRCPLMAREAPRDWVAGDGHDYAALQSYDAARMVVSSIRTGGLNRFRVCRALAQMTPWQGAAGEVRWSALNRNSRPVTLARIRGGRLEAFGQGA
ncbi:MAG: ABC transporter substrate-binding protein [Bryobacteraceae bacterium]|nr:ABC transporter substrate-binding protein [Bryobacteraceae bacterium]